MKHNKQPEFLQENLFIVENFKEFDEPFSTIVTSPELLALAVKPYVKTILNSNSFTPEIEEEIKNRTEYLLNNIKKKLLKRELIKLKTSMLLYSYKYQVEDDYNYTEEQETEKEFKFYERLELLQELEKRLENLKKTNAEDKIKRLEKKIISLKKELGLVKDKKEEERMIRRNKELQKKIEETIPFFKENIEKEIEDIVKSEDIFDALEKISYSIFLNENEKEKIKILLPELPEFLSDQLPTEKVKQYLSQNERNTEALHRKVKVHTYDVQKYLIVKANELKELIENLLDNERNANEKELKYKIQKIQNEIDKLSNEFKNIFYIKLNESKIPTETKLYINKIVLNDILKFIAQKLEFQIQFVSIENAYKLKEYIIKIENDDSIQETPIDTTLAKSLIDKYVRIREKEKAIIKEYIKQKTQEIEEKMKETA
ncbi:MAG: hypothetical protein ACK4FM_00600 [Caldimicrobium sp.]